MPVRARDGANWPRRLESLQFEDDVSEAGIFNFKFRNSSLKTHAEKYYTK